MTDSDRRRLLAAAATGLAGLFAGCAGQTTGDEPTTDTDAQTETPTSTARHSSAAPTVTPASTPTPTASPSPSPSPSPTATSTPTSTPTAVTVDSIGVSAWEVVDGPVAAAGERNPTLSLTVGQRYVVENRGWDAHPIALLDADGAALCSQDGDGRLEDDPDVDWTDDGDQFAFTVTETLASAVDTYVCTVHGPMRGDVTTAADGSTPTESPTPTDGGGYY